MAYSRSRALIAWAGLRRDAITTLAAAHAAVGEIDGLGRPRELGRPLAHAYVVRLVAEFQAYARDLHDFAAERIVDLAHPDAPASLVLVTAATEGRLIDRGNAGVGSIAQDFGRLGVTELRSRLAVTNSRWDSPTGRGDRACLQDLIELRNALAHGNQNQLDRLRVRGVADTMTWARARLPGLDRTTRALDRIVWDDLQATFNTEPW